MSTAITTTTAALLLAAAFPLSSPVHAEDSPPGWGTAIAARVIGEKCPGALKSNAIAELNAFIADDFTRSVEQSNQSPAWWADLRDKLEQSYVEKYSDIANCTEEAREQAEDMVEEVAEYSKDRGR